MVRKNEVLLVEDEVVVIVDHKSSTRKYKMVKVDILQAIIVGCKTKWLGTRILIPFIKEVRSTKYMKFISLSAHSFTLITIMDAF